VLLQCAAVDSATYDSMTQNTNGPDSAGPRMTEAIGYTKWTFQLASNIAYDDLDDFTGWTVTIFGTIDLGAYLSTRSNPPNGYGSTYTFPESSWFQLPAPSTEDTSPDEYAYANPLTALQTCLYSSIPLVAVRAVAVADDAVGDIAVIALAVP
jgi:hypothetical protein